MKRCELVPISSGLVVCRNGEPIPAGSVIRHPDSWLFDTWSPDDAVVRVSRQRGYVSRRKDWFLNPLYFSRKLGLFYVLAPAFDSTTYCYRYYLDEDSLVDFVFDCLH